MLDINFFYPRWGAEHIQWSHFLDRVQKEGYQGIEWFPFGESRDLNYDFIFDLLEQRGLKYTIVMVVVGKAKSFEDYLLMLEHQLFQLASINQIQPLFITAQIGREYFTFDQICKCIEICDKIEYQTGIPIYQETHRNKWTYGIHKIVPILEVFPNLKLTLDISHWYCVSESFLEDQQLLLSRILNNVHHVHTRIGHTQGSQVHDVTHVMYADIVQVHLDVWQKYIDIKIKDGISSFTFTTEFGPPPYLISTGNTKLDYEEQWKQNLWIKNFLAESLIL